MYFYCKFVPALVISPRSYITFLYIKWNIWNYGSLINKTLNFSQQSIGAWNVSDPRMHIGAGKQFEERKKIIVLICQFNYIKAWSKKLALFCCQNNVVKNMFRWISLKGYEKSNQFFNCTNASVFNVFRRSLSYSTMWRSEKYFAVQRRKIFSAHSLKARN